MWERVCGCMGVIVTLINKDLLISWRPGTQGPTDDALEQLTSHLDDQIIAIIIVAPIL